MTELTGRHLVAGCASRRAEPTFGAVDPTTGQALAPLYSEATGEEIDAAARAAADAAAPYAPPATRAAFLRSIAAGILDLGPSLLERARAETGLPLPRLESERGRTVSQIHLFADLVEEGSWVEATIDRALPDRTPSPRPDVRRMLVPLGPVAVFGASNFPLAFSVAGGDTASALAAGCPVVVKAHPAHPGTSELVGRAIEHAAVARRLPHGVFSLLHGASPAVGQALVDHPAIRAVAFTGSQRGGRALFDAAARRNVPIPVYAEMGSQNPVFLLPQALRERGEAIARGLATSVTLGSGQFCTNPGLVVLRRSPETDEFLAALGAALASSPTGTFVHAGLQSAYEEGVRELAAVSGVAVLVRGGAPGPHKATAAHPMLLTADAAAWAETPRLAEEIFGPATLAILCDHDDDVLSVARHLPGQLTASIHMSAGEALTAAPLLAILEAKAGRVIVNGFPTGVEVTHAMHHGGPYPAATDSRATSVGTTAILRFARPVCFQDVPPALLPEELRDENPRRLWRRIDGRLTQEAL